MKTSALFTDLYQLTMLQAYEREGMGGPAVFSLFVRRLRQRNVLVACGLDAVLTALERLRFTAEDLDYLRTLGPFSDAFLEGLRDFRFTGDVYAMPEGTPCFADEPLLEVAAPLAQAQLVETLVLNQITYATGVASKALRVVAAAEGRPVYDFGSRRAHDVDAALTAARACVLAGCAGTSNVLAGRRYGVPVVGTMAHSYVQAHDSEREALRAFAALYPGTTLLVDTYDTLDGVRKVIDLAHTLGDRFQVGALRLDSGDPVALSREARALLDAAGLEHVQLFASGSLDEERVARLVDAGVPIDGFGVGTRLVTLADRPYLSTVYKLAVYGGQGRMKLAEGKASLPGRKQVFRQLEGDGAPRDVVACSDEELPGTPLLRCVMRDGRRTPEGEDTLDAARARLTDAMDELPTRLLDLGPVEPYPVVISERLQAETARVRARLETAEGLGIGG